MSNDEYDVQYCDIDPYDRTSSEILFYLSEGRLKNDTEIEYYYYYCKLKSKASESQMLSRHYKDMIERYSKVLVEEHSATLEDTVRQYKSKLLGEMRNIVFYEKLLSKLELTTPIENILQRERKKGETITLTYLNRELPNIPHNVCASRSSFFLSSNDIALIQEIIKDSKTNKPPQKKSEPKQKLSVPPLAILLWVALFAFVGFSLLLFAINLQ